MEPGLFENFPFLELIKVVDGIQNVSYFKCWVKILIKYDNQSN